MAYEPKQVQGGSVGGFTAQRIPFAASDGTLTEAGSLSYDSSTGVLTVNSQTLTLTGNLAMSGAFNLTFTITGNTNVTLPTSGTVLTTGSSLTSAQVATMVSDETGSGVLTFATSPTFTTGITVSRNNASGPNLTLQNLTAAGGSGNANLNFVDSASLVYTTLYTDAAGNGSKDFNLDVVQAAGVFNLRVGGQAAGNLWFKVSAAGVFTILDGATFVLGSTNGCQFGTAITEKLAFYGSAPIVQRAGAAQAAVATTGATNVTPFGYTTAAQADAIVTLANELRASLVALGLVKGAA